MRRVVMDGTREFASVRDAAKYIVAHGAGKLNTVGSNISHVATQGRGTAYGHVWSYADDKRDLVAVVRCRDCKYMFDWAYDRMLCKMWADGGMDDDANVLYPTVKPDGFCAWGERKVVKR